MGYLHLLMDLVNKGVDLTYDNSILFQEACKTGHLRILKYLLSHGCNPIARDSCALNNACFFGNLQVARWLFNQGCDATRVDILHVTRRGHLHILKWIWEKTGCDLTYRNNFLIRWTSDHGVLSVIKWLYSMGCDPTANDNEAIRRANLYGYYDIVDFLVSVGCPDPRVVK